MILLATIGTAIALLSEPFDLRRHVLMLRWTGYTALIALFASQAATPIAIIVRLVGRSVPNAAVYHWRRDCGLTAAGLAGAHLGVAATTYLHDSWRFVFEQPWLRAGAVSTTILFVLAVTSFPTLVRRAMLGSAWKPLHRLAYPAMLLALLHVLTGPYGDPRIALTASLFVGLLWAVRMLPKNSRKNPITPQTKPTSGPTI